MKSVISVPTPAEAAGKVTRIKRTDGSQNFQQYKLWLNTLPEPFDNLREAFNSNFDEILKEEKPFNLSRLKALFNETLWDEINEKVSEFISDKDKALKAHYARFYADKMEEVGKAFNVFKEAFRKTMYEAGIYGTATISSDFTTLDSLPIAGDQLVIDPEKINAMRSEFDTYSDDPIHVEMAGLCQELAEVYNKIQLNIQSRHVNHPLRTRYYTTGFPSADLFITKNEDGTIKPNYNNIF